ncbi:hypothetical protein KY345_04870 [Candidatus Woesearchaeota archaeon]|nr:hypothetical protein [Candidatus Woesearchaeota archaeon]
MAERPAYILDKHFDPMYTTHRFVKPKFSETHGLEIRVKYYTGTECPDGYFDIRELDDVFKGLLTPEQLIQVATMKPGEVWYRNPVRVKPAE